MNSYLPLIVLATFPAVAQNLAPLKELNVPAASLPAGCKLKPSKQGPFLSMDTNPWITIDKRSIVFLRGFVDPQIRAPITKDPEERARYLEAQSKGVESAYVAIYSEPGAPEIGVYALRFAAPPGESERRRLSQPNVIVFDSTAVMLWVDGESRTCFEAVKSHVLAVKARSASNR